MTPQDIAKQLYQIKWLTVQCDDQFENFKVADLLSEIEKLDLHPSFAKTWPSLQPKVLKIITDLES